MSGREGHVDRRSFLRQLCIAAGACLLGACGRRAGQPAALAQPAAAQPGSVPVAKISHPNILQADGATPNLQAVLQCLDMGVKHAFGAESTEEAWRRVAGPDDVVAIKVNCISRHVFSHPVVAQAVCQRLQDVGVKAENIIIFDRSDGELARSGYAINRDGPGVRCYGTGSAYDAWLQHRGISTRLSKIITQLATVIINLAVLKHHGHSGVTLCLKNHYGTISNPSQLHGNHCDPAIPVLNDIPAIRNKTRLCIIDGTRGVFDRGPGGSPHTIWPARTIIVSANPVAADIIGFEMIEAERRRRGLGSVKSRAHYLQTAASMGLGPNGRGGMNVLEYEFA